MQAVVRPNLIFLLAIYFVPALQTAQFVGVNSSWKPQMYQYSEKPCFLHLFCQQLISAGGLEMDCEVTKVVNNHTLTDISVSSQEVK